MASASIMPMPHVMRQTLHRCMAGLVGDHGGALRARLTTAHVHRRLVERTAWRRTCMTPSVVNRGRWPATQAHRLTAPSQSNGGLSEASHVALQLIWQCLVQVGSEPRLHCRAP